jgi:transcriptional regulator with XRE-family HTH domain
MEQSGLSWTSTGSFPIFAAMSARLRQLREEEGLSRAALARAAGLSERTIKRIEDGDMEYAPTAVTKNKLRLGLNRSATNRHDYSLTELFPDEEQ